MKRILVGIDGSEISGKATRMAEEIAVRFGARLTLAHVVPPLLLPPDAYGLTLQEIDRQHEAHAGRLLADARAALGEPGVEVDTLVLFGQPAEQLATAAAAPDVGRGRGSTAAGPSGASWWGA
jgi:nucleotide-binding universal stress UspA family protein